GRAGAGRPPAPSRRAATAPPPSGPARTRGAAGRRSGCLLGGCRRYSTGSVEGRAEPNPERRCSRTPSQYAVEGEPPTEIAGPRPYGVRYDLRAGDRWTWNESVGWWPVPLPGFASKASVRESGWHADSDD